jgi:signal transduction histidine kinase
VRDNGIGIEPQYREQIFRIFQRLHTDRAYEGTGIGLAIVQKAANKLGGTVRLESEPGKGSTFTLRLPREATEVQKKADSCFPREGLYY